MLSTIPERPETYDDTKTSVSLEKLGVELEVPDSFPEKITSLEKRPADTGNQACRDIKEADGTVVLSVCATSRHFTLGRGGIFLDTHGYLESPSGFYILYPSSQEELEKGLANKYTSKSGVEILKIYGKSTETEFGFLPVQGTPGEGSIAAIINTGDPDNYDGIAIVMKLTDKYGEAEFDQILDSINFKK